MSMTRRWTPEYRERERTHDLLGWHIKERRRLIELAEAAVRAHQGPLTREMDALLTYLNETPKEKKR